MEQRYCRFCRRPFEPSPAPRRLHVRTQLASSSAATRTVNKSCRTTRYIARSAAIATPGSSPASAQSCKQSRLGLRPPSIVEEPISHHLRIQTMSRRWRARERMPGIARILAVSELPHFQTLPANHSKNVVNLKCQSQDLKIILISNVFIDLHSLRTPPTPPEFGSRYEIMKPGEKQRGGTTKTKKYYPNCS